MEKIKSSASAVQQHSNCKTGVRARDRFYVQI